MGIKRRAGAVDEGYGAYPGAAGGRFAVREQRPFHRPEKQPQYGCFSRSVFRTCS